MGPFVEHVRIPDEIRKLLVQINGKMVKHGRIEDDEIVLPKLTKRQNIAKGLFVVVCEVDELIDNLNLLLDDLDRLSDYPILFAGAGTPLKRYKLLLRAFFYEFSRFEDLFGYFLLWLERLGEISKKARKEMRNDFYGQLEPMIAMRNTMLHDSVRWGKLIPRDVFVLSAADSVNQRLVRKADGIEIDWKDTLSPVCSTNRAALYETAANMRTFWSMVIADHTFFLARKGEL